MSFIEFDPEYYDPHAVEQCPLDVSVVREAWAILASFGTLDETEVTQSGIEEDVDVSYNTVATDTINPLRKGREIYFDQLPYLDDEYVAEAGLFCMKVVHPTKGLLLHQVIFQLETHYKGPGVFYEDRNIGSRVTDESELALLALRLAEIKDAYWSIAPQLSDSMLLHVTPSNVALDSIASFLHIRSEE